MLTAFGKGLRTPQHRRQRPRRRSVLLHGACTPTAQTLTITSVLAFQSRVRPATTSMASGRYRF